MIEILGSAEYQNGTAIPSDNKLGYTKTMAYQILQSHNVSDSMQNLDIKFDAMASHDITYVGIIQTARASGLDKFPLPYVLTNCHNSLCAVGGTINEDDHLFGLSAVKKYGGEFVPAHQAVIHQYMREVYAGCGKMILGSDSHTRYGALGTMAIGEGGPELVKQLLNKTYKISYPQVVGIELTGKPKPGVGPQDVALVLVGATFMKGIVKNKVLEFFGDGINNLSVDYRMGIDVMTTETSCLSSIWVTDNKVQEWLSIHGRPDDYKELKPQNGAYYDALIKIDLNKVEPMIALPFHPSNAYTIRELKENLEDILHKVDSDTARMLELNTPPVSLLSKVKNGKLYADQGVIAGCSGGLYENLMEAADILKGKSVGNDAFGLSIYPASQPVMMELVKSGALNTFLESGAVFRSAFCGPCFGAGDVPNNGGFSIRHSTRNFPNREGSKPSDGQIAYVALMDARSIAATAANGGELTAATDLSLEEHEYQYGYDDQSYRSRVYHGVGHHNPNEKLIFGPNIADWPKQISLPNNIVMKVCSAIYDEVTTTDELIPSGETSSYRSNPLRLAEFALSRKDPKYVGRAKAVQQLEKKRQEGLSESEINELLGDLDPETTGIGSVVVALRPGDGSAREQAASCQRVLGGIANIAEQYATKRYRSNCINWGMIPFQYSDLKELNLQPGDKIVLKDVKNKLSLLCKDFPAVIYYADGRVKDISLTLPGITQDEVDIIVSGCLINYYQNN